MSEEPLISADEVASVLSQDEAGAAPEAPKAASPDSDVYSLRRPVAIAPEDEPRARKRVEGFAQALVETIRKELDTDIELAVQGFQQQQAGPAIDSLPAPCWLLTFLHGEGGGFSLVMDPTCAMSLVELALGGIGNSTSAGREPTELETRVMGNLGGALVKPLDRRARAGFVDVVFTVGRIPERMADRGEMVGAALLQLRFSGAERNAMLLVSASMLREAAAGAGKRERRKPGPLAGRLERLPVEIRPVLRAGKVTLADLSALKPGTVLRLETPEDALLDLRVDGQSLFGGHVRREDERAEFTVAWRRGRRAAAESEDER